MVALILVAALAVGVLLTWCRQPDRRLMPFAAAALACHVLSAGVQDWLQSYYGVTDVIMFADYARPIAHALEFDPARNFPQLVRLFLHFDANFGFISFDSGDSTTTMFGVTALLFYSVGTSYLLCFITVGVIAWLGQVVLARTFASFVSDDEKPMAYFAALLVPSVFFWSSAIIKEAFVAAAFGPLSWGIASMVRGHVTRGAIVALPGVLCVAVLKPYLLFPFVVAVATAIVFKRRGNSLSASSVIVGALIAVAGLLIVGSLFPDYSIGHLAENIASHQEVGQLTQGGSYTELGDAEAKSLTEQLPFFPLALFNSLFRPLPTDVHNITTAAAAVESAVVTATILVVLVKFRLTLVRRVLEKDPVLVFCLVFTLTCGAAIGLATTNIGTLSRYRMPMMPFYVLLLTLTYHRLRQLSRARSLTPAMR